jgi:hypothetical protein
LSQRKPGAGIQEFKYLNKIKNWIPAFAGMTTFFPYFDTVPRGGGLVGGCAPLNGRGVLPSRNPTVFRFFNTAFPEKFLRKGYLKTKPDSMNGMAGRTPKCGSCVAWTKGPFRPLPGTKRQLVANLMANKENPVDPSKIIVIQVAVS